MEEDKVGLSEQGRPEEPAVPGVPLDRRGRSWEKALPLVFVVLAAGLLIGLWSWWGPRSSATPAAAVHPTTAVVVGATAADVEEHYGVQLTLVALTAGGGLVDVRFRVTDPAKAAFLLKAETMPLLAVEKSHTILQVPAALDVDALLPGRVYYMLFPNGNNAVQQGDAVSVIIGNLKLEHQVVQ